MWKIQYASGMRRPGSPESFARRESGKFDTVLLIDSAVVCGAVLSCVVLAGPGAAGLAGAPDLAEASADTISPAPDTVIAQTLRALIDSANHPYLRWPHFPNFTDELEAIYAPEPYSLLWFRDGRPGRPAREAVHALLTADSHGLRPDDYDAPRLTGLLAEVDAGRLTEPADLALLDGALSIGMLRYLSSLHQGRVNPENLHLGFNLAPTALDAASVLREAIERDDVSGTVERTAPRFRQYERLRRVLTEYRRLAERGLARIEADTTVQPGEPFPGAADLRTLLVALGDLPGDAPTGPAGIYDSVLVAGVVRFQARHGLEPDGVIGSRTLRQLDTPIGERLQQIELALERWRWLTDLAGEAMVLVNIPAFELEVLDPADPDSGLALDMRVVVGAAVDKQTPAFRSDLQYIEFSPYWNIPYGIVVREILPAVAREPGYLDSHSMEIVREFSRTATALPQTEENLAAVRAGTLRLRQRPGPLNSLGGAKFVFPNSMNIYLHGTPARQLFERSRRDFSHGCIRLEDPKALAEWLLRGQPEWTAERIEQAMRAGTPENATLAAPMPVVLFYTTVVASEGPPRFYDDIYGHDGHLAAALSVGYPYPP